MGEGQFEISKDQQKSLEQIDKQLLLAVENNSEKEFKPLLEEMLNLVRSQATVLAPDYLGPSDLVLPSQDSSAKEIQELMKESNTKL